MMEKYYKKHFEDLAEQHRKKYEYYKKKANECVNPKLNDKDKNNG